MKRRITKRLEADNPLKKSGFPGVGMFDSGVGGLSVIRELNGRGSKLDFAYIADQAHAPYGERSLAEVSDLSCGISSFFIEQGVQVVVIACNTASAGALYPLREAFPEVQFVGMEPAVKPAAERTRTGKIGVLATRGTLEGKPYAGVLRRFAANVKVYARVCPSFVHLVESGEINSSQAFEAVRREVAPLLAEGVDKIALACTHYSFLAPLIREICGDRAEVIDPAAAVASQLERVTAAGDAGLPGNLAADGKRCFFTTGQSAAFNRIAHRLLNQPVEAGALHWDRPQ